MNEALIVVVEEKLVLASPCIRVRVVRILLTQHERRTVIQTRFQRDWIPGLRSG